jgi:membrane protein DedA with SNARE-associated domain
MLVFSSFPNPLFDLAGVAAGAVRMPIKRFFPAVLCGKIIKDTCLAAIGGLGATIFAHLL